MGIRRIKKVIIEFEDFDNIEFDLKTNEKVVIYSQIGVQEGLGEFGAVFKQPNGLRVVSILIGSKHLVDELSKIVGKEIDLSLCNS